VPTKNDPAKEATGAAGGGTARAFDQPAKQPANPAPDGATPGNLARTVANLGPSLPFEPSET
jgi:hypothetical protein